MNKQHLETITQMEIKKAPKEQSMDAANNQYTKNQLAHFIERHDLDIAKSWKKAEIVEALTEWMQTAQKDRLKSDTDLQSFYSDNLVNTQKPLNINEDNLTDEQLKHIIDLIEYGLAYNVDGTLWTPEETVNLTSAVESESNDSATDPKKEEPKKQIASSNQAGTTSRSASPSTGKTVDMEEKKKARLEYLKKQAKRKKKGKKRK